LTANIGFSKRFLELTGNAEITEFDLASFIEENIRGFHVWNKNGFINKA